MGTPAVSVPLLLGLSDQSAQEVYWGKEQSDASQHTYTPCSGLSRDPTGSVFRDEFDLAILQLQENNRLEILKRKWWEGGKCPKEEDHRAKGKWVQERPLLLWGTTACSGVESPGDGRWNTQRASLGRKLGLGGAGWRAGASAKAPPERLTLPSPDSPIP